MHLEDAVHVLQVDRYSAERRISVAFQRSPCAERDDRHTMPSTDAHDLLNVIRILGKHHGVGCRDGVPGRDIGMLFTHRERRDEPIAE